MKKTIVALLGITLLTGITTRANELEELKARVNELERQVRNHQELINVLQGILRNIRDCDEMDQPAVGINPNEVIRTRNLNVRTVSPPDYRYWIQAEVINTSSLVAHDVRIFFKTVHEGRKTGEFLVTARQLAPGEVWRINERGDRAFRDKPFPGFGSELQRQSIEADFSSN